MRFKWTRKTVVPARAFVLAAVAALFLSGSAARAAEGSFDRALQVTGPVELEITTSSGSIRVTSGDSHSVRVHGTIRAKGWGDAEDKVRWIEANPPIEQDGNSIRIGRFENRQLQRNVAVSYEVVTPRETGLRSFSGSGDIAVEGIRGPARATTGSGNLTLSEIGDEVEAKTGAGDVRLESIKGAVSTSTGSGGIRATGIGGAFRARTGSGDVKLEQTVAGAVDAETGSGTLELRGLRGSLRAHTGSGDIDAGGEPTGEWNVQTGSGRVNLHIPSGATFTLHAHSSSGQIDVGQSHPLLVQGTFRRGEISGTVRGGGPLLDLRTGSGNIRIE